MTIPLPLEIEELSLAGFTLDDVLPWLRVQPITSQVANAAVVKHHYLHRKTSISFAFGLYKGPKLLGVVTFGTPPSRHLQMSACPSNPALVIGRQQNDNVLVTNAIFVQMRA